MVLRYCTEVALAESVADMWPALPRHTALDTSARPLRLLCTEKGLLSFQGDLFESFNAPSLVGRTHYALGYVLLVSSPFNTTISRVQHHTFSGFALQG